MLVSLSITGLLSLAGILIGLIFVAAFARSWLFPRHEAAPSSPRSPRSPSSSRALPPPAVPRSPISHSDSAGSEAETLFGDPEYGGDKLGRQLLPRGGSVGGLSSLPPAALDDDAKLSAAALRRPLGRSFSASPSFRPDTLGSPAGRR